MKSMNYIFDGAFGTYYQSLYGSDRLCEWANVENPQRVQLIHTQYLQAGCNAIKTNTFAIFQIMEEVEDDSWKQIVIEGYRIANQCINSYPGEVFCDMGPYASDRFVSSFYQYKQVVDIFLKQGGTNFLFETLSDTQGIQEICAYIKEKCKKAKIIVSFAIQVDGYTRKGISFQKIHEQLKDNHNIDVLGLNCICGPVHMQSLLKYFDVENENVSIMPNAGYASVIANRMQYSNNASYYAKELLKITQRGVKIVGGCCGTTPEYIKEYVHLVKQEKNIQIKPEKHNDEKRIMIDHNPIRKKLENKQKVIAVEFDPPQNSSIEKFMQNASILSNKQVDAVTIADCPIARARVDSSLLACKLHREMQITAIPHMTCRDRNLNATKALLFGLEIEGIQNVLIVTGDPIAQEDRKEVKGVFNFNSKILASYIKDLNETMFEHPFFIFAALNVNAMNFERELDKAKSKIEHGVQGFMTQPVHSKQGLMNLKKAHEQLDAYILGGIMPIVSHRNALFMHNEIIGMHIDQEIIDRYVGLNKEEATALAVSISNKFVDAMEDFVDGYYLITPFSRVDIIIEIVDHIHENIE